MKQNIMFTNDLEKIELSSVTILHKIRQSLLLGLGSVLTYAVLAVSSPEPFFDNFVTIFLWLMLLLAPAIAGLVVCKFPSWQSIPLTLRINVILQSFGLSVLTLSTTIVFFLKWNPYQPGHWFMSAFVTVCYGSCILWLYSRMGRQVEQEKGELFP